MKQTSLSLLLLAASLCAFAQQPINISQVNGSAVAVVNAAGQNAASPANELLVGGQYNTSPTTITSGNMSPLQLTSGGYLLVSMGASIGVVSGDADSGDTTVAAESYQVVFNGSTWDRARSAGIGNNVAATGITASAAYGQYNSTLPTLTNGNYAAMQLNSKGEPLVQIGDGTTNVAVIAGTTALKTDMSSVAGTATVTAASGVQKVGIVGNANATVDAALGSALPTNAFAASIVPSTVAGAAVSSTSLSSSTTTTGTNIKASAGSLFGVYAINGNASTCWVQFINSASGGTLGTGSIVSFPLPASTTQPVWIPMQYPINFTTGIAVGTSTTNNGATACTTASTLVVQFK